jgi:hypothetical protein
MIYAVQDRTTAAPTDDPNLPAASNELARQRLTDLTESKNYIHRNTLIPVVIIKGVLLTVLRGSFGGG